MKINKGYFYMTGRLGRWKYFISQGNVLAHLIDRVKWHYFPKYFMAPGFPTHVDIESSSLCQLKCPMCGQRLMPRKLKGNMDFDLYRKIVDECSKRKVYSIKLSWRGEPLMNPYIWDMVKYAKDKGIKEVAFLTNGEAFKKEDIPKMINSGLDWISFSIDGVSKTYEKIRYPSKFNKIVETLKTIKEYKEKRNLKKPLVRVQTIYSAIENNPEEYFKIFEPIVDRVNLCADQIRSEKNRTFTKDRNFICSSPWQRITIAHDGTVAQCHADYSLNNPLGNFNEKSLYKIWHDGPFKKIRQIQKMKQQDLSLTCKDCCHRGLMKSRIIKVNDRKVAISEYVGQELNLENMDAKKLFSKKNR